ncbi:MAG: uroporphyrinogen decarboxylase/cobalamine-independent methonine synthase family protein [Thermincolia bacterium]
MIKIPMQMAAGIGSLPHREAAPAIRLVTETLPLMPHWPQLPLRHEGEGFIEQYIQPLVELGLMVKRPGKLPFFDTAQEDWTDKVTRFYELYLVAEEGDRDALNFFALRPQGAAGFYGLMAHLKEKGTGAAQYLKGQVSGPLTVGLQVTDQNHRAAYYQPELKDILLKALALEARWQVETLKAFGLPVVLFIDDPRIYACGLSTHITLNKAEIMEELNTLFRAIHKAGAIAGIHSCAGADWSIALESEADILSFDAYGYFSTLLGFEGQLNDFLNRGGVLAWGIVPTAIKELTDNRHSLMALWREQMEQLASRGVHRETLFRRWLVTPSCGTGLLPIEMAEELYRLAGQLAEDMGEGIT